MKRLIQLTAAGSASLLVAGAAFAAAPGTGGYGQYSVNAGVPSGCPAGATCTPLVASSNGFMQQKVDVTSGVGAGSSYIQTVIVPNGVTTTAPSTLGFTNETFTGANSNSGNLASQGVVGLITANTAGGGNTTAILARGNLAVTGSAAAIKAGTADATGIRITQNNDMTKYGDASGNSTTGTTANDVNSASQRNINFSYVSDDIGGSYMQMDEFATGNFERPMTSRRSSGAFTTGGGVLTLPDGQTIAYSAGDDIGVTLTDNDGLSGGSFGFPLFAVAANTAGNPVGIGGTLAINGTGAGGTQGNGTGNSGSMSGVVETQRFTNYTTGQAIDWTNSTTVNSTPDAGQTTTNGYANNSGMSGLAMLVRFTEQNTTTAAAPWANWDANFGNAPQLSYGGAPNATTGVAGTVSPSSAAVAFPLIGIA